MAYLREIIAICATAITGLLIYYNGDGVTLTALFTLYGALLGVEITKTIMETAAKKLQEETSK
jgi:hypothetical protein